jgi:hypothetical protein
MSRNTVTDDEIRPLAPRTTSSKPRPNPLGKPTLMQRQSSTFKYNTFPAAPPRNLGNRPSKDDMKRNNSGRNNPAVAIAPPSPPHSESGDGPDKHAEHQETPLPKKQLAILAVIALAEQTALNSISPYLPEMASTFPEVQEGQVGLYVGLIASAFALAQFATNFGWGLLSDRIGRKPIVLLGTFLTAICFVLFGMCRTMWQAVFVQVLMGSVNGNQGVISTSQTGRTRVGHSHTCQSSTGLVVSLDRSQAGCWCSRRFRSRTRITHTLICHPIYSQQWSF